MKKLALILIFIFSIGLRLWNLNEMGRTWDEAYYVTLGYHYIELAKKGDFSNFYWIQEPDNPIFPKYIYGIFSHFGDVKSFTKDNQPIFNYDLTYARFASILFTSFAIIFVVLLGWEYITPFVGILAGLMLSMNPTVLALSQIAGIDSPRLFFAAGLLYFFLSFLNNPTKKKVYIVGTLLGFSLITRFSDVFFIPILAGTFLLWRFSKKKKNTFKIKWSHALWFLLGFLQFIAIWPQPWLHLDYMIKVEKAIRFEYVNSPWEWFFGFPVHVPVIYFIVHFFIRTPLLILCLGIIGTFCMLKKRNWFFYVLLLWFCFPFLQSLYPYRQHGIRYLIEIYIPFSIFAAVALEFILKKLPNKLPYKIIILGILFVYSFSILLKTTPYYLDFFNILVGGNKNVYDNNLFELGWWGEGGREAGNYIITHAPKHAKVGYLLNPFSALLLNPNLSYSKFNQKQKYDYVVTNYYEYQKVGYNSLESGEDYYLLRKNYKLVYTVYADEAELYHIYQIKK